VQLKCLLSALTKITAILDMYRNFFRHAFCGTGTPACADGQQPKSLKLPNKQLSKPIFCNPG
jgi:hypothetical protein